MCARAFYYGCYWLEEGLDKDFIRIEKHPFDENYSVKKIHTTEKGYTYTLLSVSGVLLFHVCKGIFQLVLNTTSQKPFNPRLQGHFLDFVPAEILSLILSTLARVF